MPTIYFDMDGTIADFYSVEDWLAKLMASDPSVYTDAMPMLRFCTFARMLNKLQRKGYKIGIVSWLSRGGSASYNEAATAAKIDWLNHHLPSVNFDEIKIVPWGIPKASVVNDPSGILFDDEENNRINWRGTAFGADNIMEVLKAL